MAVEGHSQERQLDIEAISRNLVVALSREKPYLSGDTLRLTQKMVEEALYLSLVVFPEKQELYGRESVGLFGLVGIVIRLHDKWRRLYNLLNKQGGEGEFPVREGIADTLLDIAGYALIGRLLEGGKW